MSNDRPEIILTVSDSRGVFTFEEWQKMPPEVPPPLLDWRTMEPITSGTKSLYGDLLESFRL